MGPRRAASLTERALVTAVWLLGLGVGGCASYGSHLAATPIAPGNNELSIAADVLVVDRGFGPQLLPNPELGMRWGVVDDLDFGARVNVGTLEANARWRLVDATAFDLSVVPGGSFGFVPATNQDAGLFNASALGSLLGGVALGRNQLVLGARGMATYAFPLTAFRGVAYGAKWFYLPGGTLGVRIAVGETTYLFPDLNVLVPYDTARNEWGFPMIQGGIALQFE